ncbi:MAG: hypothetical protein RL148_2247 [Planctomycetota bacterium]|jgi:RNA recognition motif-containing protein
MGKRLYVGNLPYDATEAALLEVFGQDGRKVEKVHIVLDRETGRPRGFAFVEMATDEQARAAMQALDGKDFRGRMMRINEAEDRRPGGPRPGGPGGAPRPAGGFGGPSRGPGPGGPRPPFGGGGGGPSGGGAPRRPWDGPGGGGGGGGADDKKRYEKKTTKRKHDDEEDFGGPRRGGKIDYDDDWG